MILQFEVRVGVHELVLDQLFELATLFCKGKVYQLGHQSNIELFPFLLDLILLLILLRLLVRTATGAQIQRFLVFGLSLVFQL
jgi:hypothetical protein